MPKFKMRGGTAFSGEHLCKTCRHGQVVKGQRLKEEFTYCSQMSSRISFPVAECTDYDDKKTSPLWAMKDAAWLLVTKSAGNKIGFVKRADLKDKSVKDELDNL